MENDIIQSVGREQRQLEVPRQVRGNDSMGQRCGTGRGATLLDSGYILKAR